MERNYLKELREQQRLSMQKTAAALSLDTATGYFYIEKGTTKLTVDTIINLSNIFGVSPVELFEKEVEYVSAKQ